MARSGKLGNYTGEGKTVGADWAAVKERLAMGPSGPPKSHQAVQVRFNLTQCIH